jgi:hypothetical protein
MMLLRRFPGVLGLLAGLREQAVIRRIRRAGARLDEFDAIANFSLSVTPLNDQPDETGEADRLMAIPEFAALIFAERSRKRIADRSRSARALSTMHALIPGALIAANMRTMFSLIRASDKTNEPGRVVPRLTHAAISREVFLRLPRFQDKETQLLKELFTGEVRHSLVEKLGFGAEEMFAVYETLNSFVAQSAFDRIRRAAKDLDKRIAESPELLAFLENHPGGIEEAKNHIATVQGFSDFGSAISLTFQQLKERTNLADEPLRALLNRLSIDLDAKHIGLVKDFLAGNNPMRTRPFVTRTSADGEKVWLLVQPTWLIFGMRELFEIELSAKPMDQKYMKRRGELLERRGMRALVNSLRPDTALVNVEYTDDEHKRFEADGLILIGNVAIVLEAKSNRITPLARSGAAGRLWVELGPIITKAAEQAERLRALIQEGSSLHIRSASSMQADGTVDTPRKNWDLDTGIITEVFTVALSLEDLNFIATVTAELVESGLIPAGTSAPWIANVHDLEIATKLLARPSELVHFLSRRRRAADKNTVLASDELDYVMHYLTMGLYTDEDVDVTELISSLTEDLDAWYFYESGQRTTYAPKPAQPLSPDMIDTLDLLDTHRPRGWLQASLNLLEMDLPQRAQLSGAPRDLRATTKTDRRLHSMYVEVNAPVGERFGYIAMSFKAGTPKVAMEAQFLQYTTLRQYASRLEPVSAFAAWQGSQSPFDIFLHLDSDWSFDQRLEAAVTKAGIQRSGQH